MMDTDEVVRRFTERDWMSYGVKSDDDPDRSKYYPDNGVMLFCEEDTSEPRQRIVNENPETKAEQPFKEFAVLKFRIDTSKGNYAFAEEVEKARFYVLGGEQVISSPMPLRPGPDGEVTTLTESVHLVYLEEGGSGVGMLHTLVWPESDISKKGFVSRWYCCGYPPG